MPRRRTVVQLGNKISECDLTKDSFVISDNLACLSLPLRERKIGKEGLFSGLNDSQCCSILCKLIRRISLEVMNYHKLG